MGQNTRSDREDRLQGHVDQGYDLDLDALAHCNWDPYGQIDVIHNVIHCYLLSPAQGSQAQVFLAEIWVPDCLPNVHRLHYDRGSP